MQCYSISGKKILTRTVLLFIAFILGIMVTGLDHINVQANPGPDLIVQDITLSPAEPSLGDTVSITITIKNRGTTNSDLSHFACYIDDIIFTSGYIDPVAAGSIRTTIFSWTAQAGSHTITAIADSSDMIYEDDETNNNRTFNFTTIAADLIIQSVTWSPENPSKGDDVVFSISVKNQGNGQSPASTVNFYIGGYSPGYQDLPAINSGGTVTKTYDWIAPAGQHTATAVVDETVQVNESDETNNEYSLTFSTLSPDLIIKAITWEPENPSKNDALTFITTVENQGSGRADSCDIGFYIDEIYHSAKTVSSLEAGTAVNITLDWTVLSYEHQFKAVVDLYKNLAESNETNNEKTVNLLSLAPDLKVKDITWTPVDAGTGDTITFSATIINQGSGTAEASHISYLVAGSYSGYLNIPVLEAGAEVIKTFEWSSKLNTLACSVNVIVDHDRQLPETDETNNGLTKTVTLALPDLTISNIMWTPENPSVGDMVTFTVEVENQGGGKAGNLYIAYYLDNSILDSDRIYAIEAGASTNMTHTWQAQNGRHTFKAIIDSTNHVSESNENNNERSVAVIPNMPDLIIDSVTWPWVSMTAGEEVIFSVSVRNQGSTTAPPSRLVCYIDGQAVGYQDIGQINAGGTITETFLWIATDGPHIVELIIDANDIVSEFNETNNKRTVNLPPPDLIIQDITWSPIDAGAGDTVTFTATITNQGSGKAHGSILTYYIDEIVVSSQNLSELNAGQTISHSYDWIAETGMHNVRIYIDNDDLITETDETNNEKSAVFSSLTPDLVFDSIKWTMEDALIDNEVTFTITLRNQGGDEAGISRLTYYIDDVSVDSENITMLEPEETVELTLITLVEAGLHVFKVVADSENQISENDETNNEDELSFSTIAPDLVVKNISWSPTGAGIGDTLTVTVKIENRGRGKALNPRLDLQVDGSSIGYVDIEEINVGGILTEDFTWIVEEGLHEIEAFIDLDELILENNEDNNTKTATLTFSPPEKPDHQVVDLSSTDESGGGLFADSWWMIAMAAALLGGAAFYIAFKSFKQE